MMAGRQIMIWNVDFNSEESSIFGALSRCIKLPRAPQMPHCRHSVSTNSAKPISSPTIKELLIDMESDKWDKMTFQDQRVVMLATELDKAATLCGVWPTIGEESRE